MSTCCLCWSKKTSYEHQQMWMPSSVLSFQILTSIHSSGKLSPRPCSTGNATKAPHTCAWLRTPLLHKARDVNMATPTSLHQRPPLEMAASPSIAIKDLRKEEEHSPLPMASSSLTTWVVPYNPYLSHKYNAHINLEMCASLHVVCYLYKYIYKGHDATSVAVNGNAWKDHDEIRNFQDACYISSCESLWRIFRFPLHGRSPAVNRLPVHLQGQQWVTFRDGQSVQEAVNMADRHRTKLEAWFALNAHIEHARQYTYAQTPMYFVWDTHRHQWCP